MTEERNNDTVLRPEAEKPPLPDCVNCDGEGCGGSGSGCGSGCSSGCDKDASQGCGGCAAKGSDYKFNVDREPRGKIFATDWLDNISTSADFPIVQVQFKNTRNGFYLNPSNISLNIGDVVAVEASPGHDIGRVSMVGPLVALQMKKYRLSPETSELKKLFRIATDADLLKFEEARRREHPTMIRSRVIAEELGLDMKIGDVEFQGDGTKAIFYYIADERVDFRKLIRILADEFHVRIEMKQIGARQEAGRIGGIGPCGRPLCCSSWMTHFVSVGTGAARMQDLSMNPQKLAGQCAKLKCCLNFEIDTYAEASRKLPARDIVLQTIDSDYYYFKADILQRLVTYSTDKKIPANLITIPADRAFEIIEMNKQGQKPDQLDIEKKEKYSAPKEYIDLTDQDSLTRFDNSRKQKRKQKGKNGRNHESQQKQNPESQQKSNQKQNQEPQQKSNQKQNQEPQQKGNQKQKQNRRQNHQRPPKPDKNPGSSQE